MKELVLFKNLQVDKGVRATSIVFFVQLEQVFSHKVKVELFHDVDLNLESKPMDWFLYNRALRHDKVNLKSE